MPRVLKPSPLATTFTPREVRFMRQLFHMLNLGAKPDRVILGSPENGSVQGKFQRLEHKAVENEKVENAKAKSA